MTGVQTCALPIYIIAITFYLINIAQGSRLEGLVTGQGRICDFDLKPHPESNFTEQHWELVKHPLHIH